MLIVYFKGSTQLRYASDVADNTKYSPYSIFSTCTNLNKKLQEGLHDLPQTIGFQLNICGSVSFSEVFFFLSPTEVNS